MVRYNSCKTYDIVYARVAQLVEHNLAKVGAAGSSPVSRFQIRTLFHRVLIYL